MPAINSQTQQELWIYTPSYLLTCIYTRSRDCTRPSFHTHMHNFTAAPHLPEDLETPRQPQHCLKPPPPSTMAAAHPSSLGNRLSHLPVTTLPFWFGSQERSSYAAIFLPRESRGFFFLICVIHAGRCMCMPDRSPDLGQIVHAVSI